MAGTKSGSAPQVTCGMLLLAVLALPLQSTADASRFLSAFQQSYDSASKSEVIRAELLHRDHPLSPLAPPAGTTLAGRWAAAAKRSGNLRTSRGRRGEPHFQTNVTNLALEYVMSISFGTPPQRFTGLVDTGSDLMWVQCVACPGCHTFPQADPLYDPSKSSSEQNVSCTDPSCTNFPNSIASCTLQEQTCGIEYRYGDGSDIRGILMTEVLTLSNKAGANPTASGIYMGCMNNNSGLFDRYDGIVGFGRGNYSLPSQLSARAYLPVFSYCLVPFEVATTNTSTLTFGTPDPNNALGLVYTPILFPPIFTSLYYVNMTGISINGVALDIPACWFEVYANTSTFMAEGGVIFDTGTPLTYFDARVWNRFQQALSSVINITYPDVVVNPDIYCFNISSATTPVYPSVTFHFGGVDRSVVDFDLLDVNLFGTELAGGVTGVSCLLILPHRRSPMIIGNVAQANHYIETDVANKRLGWITKDCTVGTI